MDFNQSNAKRDHSAFCNAYFYSKRVQNHCIYSGIFAKRAVGAFCNFQAANQNTFCVEIPFEFFLNRIWSDNSCAQPPNFLEPQQNCPINLRIAKHETMKQWRTVAIIRRTSTGFSKFQKSKSELLLDRTISSIFPWRAQVVCCGHCSGRYVYKSS